MKVIIAGSRKETNYAIVETAIEFSEYKITEVISGGCRGVDKFGERWAKEHKIPCRVFNADWAKYGKSAGPKRNRAMAEEADALIAILYPRSRGTQNMIKTALKQGLKVFVHTPIGVDCLIV